MRIIPAIDLQAGHCVRLLHGDFDKVTRYEADPLELARRYRDAGAGWLHLVDLDGAQRGEPVNEPVIRQVSALAGLSVQTGGGIRSQADLEAALARGASRVVLGSLALLDPAATAGWLRHYGAERMVLALDVRLDASGEPRLASHGWTRQTEQGLWATLEFFCDAGLSHVLCTDIGRDGAMTGPNLALYTECMRRFPALQLQASGGVRNAADLRALEQAGIPWAIVGKALLDGRITLQEIAPFSPSD